MLQDWKTDVCVVRSDSQIPELLGGHNAALANRSGFKSSQEIFPPSSGRTAVKTRMIKPKHLSSPSWTTATRLSPIALSRGFRTQRPAWSSTYPDTPMSPRSSSPFTGCPSRPVSDSRPWYWPSERWTGLHRTTSSLSSSLTPPPATYGLLLTTVW